MVNQMILRPVGAEFDNSEDITVVDTDVELAEAPTAKTGRVKTVWVNNRSGVTARIRAWDAFTDVNSVVHTSAANQVVRHDQLVAAGEYVAVAIPFSFIGSLVFQSDQQPVTVGITGQFEGP